MECNNSGEHLHLFSKRLAISAGDSPTKAAACRLGEG